MKTYGISVMSMLACMASVTTAARIKEHMQGTKASKCCCKNDKCRPGSKGTIYQPDEHLCCKERSTCKSSMLDKHNYIDERGAEYCSSRVPALTLPDWSGARPEPVDTASIEPHTHAHTLVTHCKKPDKDDEEEGANLAASHAISMFAKELTDNSVLASSRELFTMYACIRWAPDVNFQRLAIDELETGQLPSNANVAGDDALLLTARAAERGQFIPLRCSENIGVYDDKNRSQQHFPLFERRINAMASFFKEEADKFFDERAKRMEQERPWEFFWTKNETTKSRWNELLDDTHIFNSRSVKQALKACDAEATDLSLHVRKASGEQLLNDCSFLKWWAPKLEMYMDRFPFEGFLAGSKESNLKPGNRVLICFGKRVAGELHRRKEGSHILTDMNGVGCHGFWDYRKAAEMLNNIVQIWAPPTCQLTELELKMRARMLSMFAEMNKKLFESLPALIASEQFNDAHPSARETGGVNSLLAGGKWVANKMSSLFDTYKSLGELMTSSVMKWSVCPIGEAEGLDKVLGSDDLLVQKYTQEAYSQWTKQEVALPGETCTVMSGTTEQCSIGKVREDYPEPYTDRHGAKIAYACPALPLMPAAQQLKILADAHKTKCLIQASPEQLGALSPPWHYKGLRPAEVQYPPRDHAHDAHMEMVQILDHRNNLDEFGISRSYVTVGRVCTLEVQAKYPLWCTKPALINQPTIGTHVASALSKMGEAVSGMAQKASIFGSNNDKAGWKSWAKRQALSVGAGFSNLAHSMSPAAISNMASSLSGTTKDRYNRITRNRMYESVEAGEALWGMTFQKGEDGGGERNQFDRYVVTVPCDGVDVREDIASEFSWGQVALEVLEKASGANTPKLLDAATFTLGVRTEVELHDGGHMPRVQHLSWKANDGEWSSSQDNFPHTETLFELGSLTALDASMPNVFGAKMSFSCGRREDIYIKRDSGKPFKQCVADGMNQAHERAKLQGREAAAIEQKHADVDALKDQLRTAQEAAAKDDSLAADVDKLVMAIQSKEGELAELLREKPLTLKEYDDEIVVRVVFANLSPKCEFFKGKLDEVSQAGSAQDAALEAKKNREAAEAMKAKGSGCTPVSAPTKHKGSARSGIMGAYMGNEAPANSREEVIFSALDLKSWIPK